MELPGEPVAEVGGEAHWGKDCVFRGVCVCVVFSSWEEGRSWWRMG